MYLSKGYIIYGTTTLPLSFYGSPNNLDHYRGRLHVAFNANELLCGKSSFMSPAHNIHCISPHQDEREGLVSSSCVGEKGKI